jgi:hypothetical protein
MTLADQLMRLNAENSKLRQLLPGGGGGGEGPQGPEMTMIDDRFRKVEARVDTADQLLQSVDKGVAVINARIEALGSRFDALDKGISALSTRLDSSVATALSRVPSWWQIPAAIGVTVTLLLGLYTLAKHFQVLP